MKAIFGRKMTSLEELKSATIKARQEGLTGTAYQVTKELYLNERDFRKFAEDMLEDQSWIEKNDGGHTTSGEARCIRVLNQETGERVLVNSEGYSYPRYTAVEEN